MIIRKYESSDKEEINKLGCFLHDNYTISLDTFSNCIVLEEDKKIIGFITYSIIYERAEVIDIIIESPYRNKGYGKILLNNAISDIKENNCINITLEVNEKNIAAINLYKSLGFDIIAKRNNYYKDNDAYLMELVVK